MARETIAIQVEPDAARAYTSAPEERRRKLDLLLDLRLREATRPGADLETIMDEIAARARERGLTEATLDELLAHE
jgi:hypothetical protein